MNERAYIRKRRIKAFVYSIPFYICRVFPIKKNKIVFWTLEGAGGYSCNPKYIAEEIIKRNNNGQTNFELYWIVKDLNKEFPTEIHKIKDTWWNRAYHMTTARIWIGNTRTFWGTRKRKGTYYYQTWHGSISLKPIGKYRGKQFSKIAYLVSKADSDLVDLAVSGDRWCTEMWPDGLIYGGEIKQLGLPRCDVIVNANQDNRKKFRQEIGLAENSKLVIYAPTFRGGSQATERSVSDEQVKLDFGKILDAFESRFGGEWHVLLRLHPQLANKLEKMNIANTNPRIIDVTQRADMNEIMAVTDAIITDYSTCIFEGFLNGQPGFIFADDIEEYVTDRGKLMFEMDEIPFSVSKNEEELIRHIDSFDEETYKKKCIAFKAHCGITEYGDATVRVVDYIESKM